VENGDAAALASEIRVLKAKTEDQAGEIARLKAALAAFENQDQKGRSIRDSKVALKARLSSAEAQSEQQAATIGRLRAELAASHERLARQAAHFMDEMRRIGIGAVPASSLARRRPEQRSLAQRVAQVRSTPSTAEVTSHPAASREAEPESAAANGRNGKVSETQAPASEAEASPAAPAPEMPKAPEIPAGRRRLRLLDRITGLPKN
jgi:hypothetical protein